MFARRLSLLFILTLLFACDMKQKLQEEIKTDWKTFETDEYSVKYPPDWLVNTSGYKGTSFLIISKQTSIRDFYQENVSLIEEELSDSMDLVRYVDQSIAVIRDTVVQFEIIKDSLWGNDPIYYHQLIFQGQEGMYKITSEKYYISKSNKVYELTFSGKTLEQSRYLPIGEGIMNGFRVK